MALLKRELCRQVKGPRSLMRIVARCSNDRTNHCFPRLQPGYLDNQVFEFVLWQVVCVFVSLKTSLYP